MHSGADEKGLILRLGRNEGFSFTACREEKRIHETKSILNVCVHEGWVGIFVCLGYDRVSWRWWIMVDSGC